MQRRRGPAATLATIGVLFMLWFVGSADPAQACSCVGGRTEADIDAAAGTIVFGRAVAVEDAPVEVEGAVPDRIYTVRVEQLLKGEITDPVRFRTAADSAACGVELPLDTLYKLYPDRDPDGGYSINLCGGHRPATAADLEPPTTTTTATATTIGSSRATTSTSGPISTTAPPPLLSTTSTALTIPTSGSSTTLPDDDVALSIDDDSDDSGGGGLLRTVGIAAVAAVAGAALATWRARRVAIRPPEDADWT